MSLLTLLAFQKMQKKAIILLTILFLELSSVIFPLKLFIFLISCSGCFLPSFAVNSGLDCI